MRWTDLLLSTALLFTGCAEPEPPPPEGVSTEARRVVVVEFTVHGAPGPAEDLSATVPELGDFGPMAPGEGAHTLVSQYDPATQEVVIHLEVPLPSGRDVAGPVTFRYTLDGQPQEGTVTLER